MARHHIELANVTTDGYTYVYTGSLANGDYYLTATDWECYVLILDTDPDEFWDCNDDEEWQEAHTVRKLTGEDALRFWLEMLDALEFFGGCESDVICSERRYVKSELRRK